MRTTRGLGPPLDRSHPYQDLEYTGGCITLDQSMTNIGLC
jgi:hypothetical protein